MKLHMDRYKWAAVIGVAFIAVVGIPALVNASLDTKAKREAAVQEAAQETPVCQVDAGKLLEYINTERTKLGAPALQIDSTLATASKYKLDNLIAEKYYSHAMANGDAWHKYVRSLGVNAAISEDLNYNDATPEQSWEEFKASPDHYASLTNAQFTRIGIAAQCTDYVIEKSIEAGDEKIVGQRVMNLTSITLAAPEPAVQPVASPTAPDYSNFGTTTCNTTPNYSGYGTTTRCY